jgi:phosphatidylglycerophosphate synthase
VQVAADALSVARLALAAVLPGALASGADAVGGSWVPLGLVAAGALTDLLDGVVARRAPRSSRHGALLDGVADVALVLAATIAAAARGLVPIAVPVAVVTAFTAYAFAAVRGGPTEAGWRRARTRLGHAAGVLNYGLAGLIGLAVAMPARAWAPALGFASLVVIGVNLGAVVDRVARTPAAPGDPTTPAAPQAEAGSCSKRRVSSSAKRSRR